MATSKSFRNIELTSGGGTIELDVSKPYDVYYFFTQGSVTLSSNWTITHTGTPHEGMEIEVRWRADVDLSGNNISFFGSNMDGDITDKEFTAVLAYNGSSWDVMKSVDYEEDQTINSDHIKDGSIQGSDMDFDNLLGDGLTDDSSLIIVQRDTTSGTSILTSDNGTRLDGDENTPDDGTYYGKTGGNKGWFTLGAGMSRYDSGWKQFPDYSSSSNGFLDITNWNNGPFFRIIGRTVYFGGRLLIPLDNGSGSLVSDADNYITTSQVGVHTAGSGITINTDNSNEVSLLFPDLLGDTDLRPEIDADFYFKMMKRRLVVSDIIISMTAVTSTLDIRSNGTMRLSSIVGHETSSGIAGGVLENNQFRQLNTKANSSDYVLDWSGYRTAHDGGSFQNNQAQSSVQFGVTIDTNQAGDWGGFILDMDNVYYHIDSSTSLETIQSKFSNYSDA